MLGSRLKSCWVQIVAVTGLALMAFGGLWLVGSFVCAFAYPNDYRTQRDDGPLMVLFGLRAVASPAGVAVVALLAVCLRRLVWPEIGKERGTDMQPADHRVTRWTLIGAAILFAALLAMTWFWSRPSQ